MFSRGKKTSATKHHHAATRDGAPHKKTHTQSTSSHTECREVLSSSEARFIRSANNESTYESRSANAPPLRAWLSPSQNHPSSSETNHTDGCSNACNGCSKYRNIVSASRGFQWNGGIGNHHGDYERIESKDESNQWNGGVGNDSSNAADFLRLILGFMMKDK